jgi:hypothetical protein
MTMMRIVPALIVAFLLGTPALAEECSGMNCAPAEPGAIACEGQNCAEAMGDDPDMCEGENCTPQREQADGCEGSGCDAPAAEIIHVK